jgi:RecB family exonuclease
VFELEDPRRRQALTRLARKQLLDFLAEGGLIQAPQFVEQSFSVDLGQLRLRGVIDRVDGGDPPVLVDYKTGSELPAAGLRRDLQLALYALAAERALGIKDSELEIIYLRNGKKLRLRPDRELLEEAERIAGEVATGIRCADFAPRPERRRCRGCPYRLPCEAAL